MYSIPGIFILLIFLILHPQEYFTWLGRIPVLNLALLLGVLGFVLDVRLGFIKLEATRTLRLVLAFVAWCLFDALVVARSEFQTQLVRLLVPVVLYLLIAHGIQTFRALQILIGVVLATTVFLSFVGVHQKFAPKGCFPAETANRPTWDGRYCVDYHQCENGEGAEPGFEYICEHVGLFGTYSVGGERVRFLGKLEDPNELALTVGIGLPFAIGFMTRRRTILRTVGVAVAFVLGGLCAVFTQSRGGQLVFLSVIGAYVLRKDAVRRGLIAALVAVPILLYGGREGADDSSEERLECIVAGMKMFLGNPLFGVGPGQFTDHHILTAHNSFVLAPAELGLPGMIIWTLIVYMSVKIPVAAVRRYIPGGPHDGRAGVAADWSMALMAGWCGMVVGIFFLSFCYKEVLWAYFGLSGAFYICVRRHDPEFEVELSSTEIAGVAVADVVLLVLLNVYARARTG